MLGDNSFTVLVEQVKDRLWGLAIGEFVGGDADGEYGGVDGVKMFIDVSICSFSVVMVGVLGGDEDGDWVGVGYSSIEAFSESKLKDLWMSLYRVIDSVGGLFG